MAASGADLVETPHVHAAPDTAPSGRFGRMFRLPPFASPNPALEAALRDIGRSGGIMDAKDDLSKGPVLLITDLSLSVNNRNNPSHTAGTTFMGQFMDHDMTFDASSPLGQPTRPERTANERTPAFDLDSVYGRGPIADPQYYDASDRAKLKVESGGLFEDVPRAPDRRALIADPRNDEHIIISGLQAAFLKFHNRAVDAIRAQGDRDQPAAVFAQARRMTTWHYQWMILHEFLPQFIGQRMVNDILRNGPRFYTPKGSPFIPVEFQAAAYRFGHSMIRPSYRANLKGHNGGAFFGMVFDPSLPASSDPDDLSGGHRARRRFIGWQTFFDFGDGEVKPNKRIDTKLSTPLFNLPLGAIAGNAEGVTSLPQRNLLRHLTWELPSGQDLAREMGLPVLSARDLSELRAYEIKLERSTPLWYYILKEAEVMEDGLQLGPVGGRVVGEVIIGLLQNDRDSYLSEQPDWKPVLPSSGGRGTFRMVDFLTFARVDPASRGQ